MLLDSIIHCKHFSKKCNTFWMCWRIPVQATLLLELRYRDIPIYISPNVYIIDTNNLGFEWRVSVIIQSFSNYAELTR